MLLALTVDGLIETLKQATRVAWRAQQTAQDVLALAGDPSYDLSAYLLVPTGGLVPM